MGRLWWLGVRQRPAAMGIAWLVAMAVACSELSATIMVNPPGITTLPICVFRLLHAGVRNQVAALCLTSLLGVALITLLLTWLAARWVGNHPRGARRPPRPIEASATRPCPLPENGQESVGPEDDLAEDAPPR